MDSRAEFERWAAADLDVYDFSMYEGGDYCEENTENMWTAWQASRQGVEGEPRAYEYQWRGKDRVRAVSKPEHLPTNGDDLIVTPLYTHPASADVPDAEYFRALQEAFDIIQSDANTEENYRSMCQIGSVLRKLKAKKEKGQ